MLNDLGMVYFAQGKLADARGAYTEALTHNEQSLGKDHLSVSTGLHNLAQVATAEKKFDEAAWLL